ncbi:MULTISPECIES: hypothetical protein [unclassified Pseudomonas]|uniref:hypothetical protein n=1 Tax=unclassified Pseudomonas TaxID=196821 RepID=UPI001B32BB3E|nr:MULTISPECIES: hypothetical protein [unclassified Pseudomonas]MBP5945793.1 hypothetical protein [Pseudomonas sp. P9(2020)]MBZ9563333.1 hypothetical protein [Pseudomonas sp. P116]
MNTHEVPNSPTWFQEFKPYVNGQHVRWPDLTLNLLAGEVCTLTLDYEYSWLIGASEGHIGLYCLVGEAGLGLIFEPPLEQLIEMAIGTTSVSWTITAQNAPSAAFVLQFGLSPIAGIPRSPPVPGTILNLAQELEVKFDEFDVAFAGSAFPCLGAKHTLTVRPKPSSQLLGKLIKLQWEKAPGANLGVVITPALGEEELLTQEGKTWDLDCLNSTRSGDFSLQLTLVKSGLVTSPLAMSMAHNLVKVERWQEEHWAYPAETWFSHHIRATSVFLNKPADGVQVKLVRNGHVSYLSANSNGEAQVSNRDGASVGLSVFNRYDGVEV